MARFLDHGLQLLAGMEGDDAAGADRDLPASFRVATGALRLFPGLGSFRTREAGPFSARPSRIAGRPARPSSTSSLAPQNPFFPFMYGELQRIFVPAG